MVFAGLAYTAQKSIELANAPQKQRDEALSVDRIIRASFARSTYAGILPGLIDTTLGTFVTDEPIFNFRTTGLASDFIMGVPTIDFIQKSAAAVGGVTKAAMRSDYDYSQQDLNNLWRLLPLNNLTGMSNLRRGIASATNMPERPTTESSWR